jgi:hypothetical protein
MSDYHILKDSATWSYLNWKYDIMSMAACKA